MHYSLALVFINYEAQLASQFPSLNGITFKSSSSHVNCSEIRAKTFSVYKLIVSTLLKDTPYPTVN